MYLEPWRIAVLIIACAMGGGAVGVVVMELMAMAKDEWKR